MNSAVFQNRATALYTRFARGMRTRKSNRDRFRRGRRRRKRLQLSTKCGAPVIESIGISSTRKSHGRETIFPNEPRALPGPSGRKSRSGPCVILPYGERFRCYRLDKRFEINKWFFILPPPPLLCLRGGNTSIAHTSYGLSFQMNTHTHARTYVYMFLF